MGIKAVVITKKQLDIFLQIEERNRQLVKDLSTAVAVVVAGVEEDIPQWNYQAVKTDNGVCQLVLEVPEATGPELVKDAANG